MKVINIKYPLPLDGFVKIAIEEEDLAPYSVKRKVSYTVELDVPKDILAETALKNLAKDLINKL